MEDRDFDTFMTRLERIALRLKQWVLCSAARYNTAEERITCGQLYVGCVKISRQRIVDCTLKLVWVVPVICIPQRAVHCDEGIQEPSTWLCVHLHYHEKVPIESEPHLLGSWRAGLLSVRCL